MNPKSFRYFMYRGSSKMGYLFKILSEFFYRLPVAIVPPGRLIDNLNIHFNHERRVALWSRNTDSGLSFYEEEFVQRYNIKKGTFLVIASGGGRETFGLAKKGFYVTGIDISEGLVKFCREKAKKENIDNAEFRCISMHDFRPEKRFDHVFFSGRSYGYIPTRSKRIEFLKKVKAWMNPEGRFLISFVARNEASNSYCNRGKRRYFFPIYKALAYLTLGNTRIEKGDVMLGEEWHHLHTDEEMVSEATEAGFGVEKLGKEKGNYVFLKPTDVK